MKIIAKGDGNKKWRATALCIQCGCVFEFEDTECTQRFTEDGWHFADMDCPECGKPVHHRFEARS